MDDSTERWHGYVKFSIQIIGSIFGEHFVKLAVDTGQHKPLLWFQYVGVIFVLWPQGPHKLQVSSTTSVVLRSSIWFAKEIKPDRTVPFPEVVVIWKGSVLATEFTDNLLTQASTSTLNVIIFSMTNEDSFRFCTIWLLPQAKNDKICLIKLTMYDVIFSSAVIPNGSLTQFLIQRVVVM
jgi:hypothetical protein